MRRICTTLLSLPIVLMFGSVSAAQIVIDPTPNVQVTNRDTRAVTAPGGSRSTLIPFTVDPSVGGGDAFDVAVSNPAAVVTLILPDDTEVGASNADALGFVYTIIPEQTFDNTIIPSLLAVRGTHALIRIPPSSLSGTYRVRVDASGASDDTLVIASYISTSSVRAGLLTDSPLYRSGDTVLLVGLLFDGSTPVRGATAVVRIGDPKDLATDPAEVILEDSGTFDAAPGDGIYTGLYTPSRTGSLTAALRATGTSTSGMTFSRTVSTSFRVLPPRARFKAFSDQGVDDNSNGLIDRVVVATDLDVQTAGRYQFGVTLTGSNKGRINASTVADVPAGTTQVAASFSAVDIASLGVDGPYVMNDAVLTYQDDAERPVVDFRKDAGQTSAYPLSSLDRGSIFFTGRNTATGIDSNGNGRFEILRIEAEAFTLRGGFYQWSGRLVDRTGVESDFFSASGNLVSGNNVIAFDFDGSKIGRRCIDGPYVLRSVLIFGAGSSLIVNELFRTEAFSALQFENAACLVTFAEFTPTVEILENGLRVRADFALLGAASDGINPLTEDVVVKVATFSTTIPAGRFKGERGNFRFEGAIDGVELAVEIEALENRAFAFRMKARGPDLSSVGNPIEVTLRIGKDTGTASVFAFSVGEVIRK